MRVLLPLFAAWALLATSSPFCSYASCQAPAPEDKAPSPPATAAASKSVPGDLGDPSPVPDGAPKLLSLVTRQRLAEHAYWLADDARQGRYTGSTAQRATADYVQKQWKALGLLPLGDKKTYVQSYPLQAVVLHPSSSASIAGVEIRDLAVLPAADTEKLTLSGKVLWCGKGRAEEAAASSKGRIPVVVFEKSARSNGPGGDLQAIQRYKDLAQQLAKLEARAGIVLLPGDPGGFGNALNYYGLMPDHPQLSVGSDGRKQAMAVPLVVIAGPNATKVLTALGIEIGNDGEFAPAGELKVTAKLALRIDRSATTTATNVCAVLEGSDNKAEALVLSAHHDHIGRRVDGDAFNGADDNASGTAGLLTLAEAFVKCGERPSRSIVFLSVSGEELGLWGSKYYSEHPTWPLARIVANINIDMIGRAEPEADGSRIQITPSKDHAKYSSIGRLAASLAPRLKISFTSGDAYYERSDHYNFAVKGVPVVFLCDGEHPDYHQVSDSADRLDYPRMESVARLLAWTAWDVAAAKDKPKELGKQTDW
jgi:hypothetical protein